MQKRIFVQPIEQPPRVAWSFVADPANDIVWREEIVGVDLIYGAPREAGATYRETVRWQQFETEVELSIAESVEPSRVLLVSEGPAYRSSSLWTFEPQGHGALVSLVFSIETTGAMHLAEGIITEMISRWLERDLPRLQGHLQSFNSVSM